MSSIKTVVPVGRSIVLAQKPQTVPPPTVFDQNTPINGCPFRVRTVRCFDPQTSISNNCHGDCNDDNTLKISGYQEHPCRRIKKKSCRMLSTTVSYRLMTVLRSVPHHHPRSYEEKTQRIYTCGKSYERKGSHLGSVCRPPLRRLPLYLEDKTPR